MIRFENVTKVYPGDSRPALDNISLEVAKGEFVFLVGASGSGQVDLPAAGAAGGAGHRGASCTSPARTSRGWPAGRCRSCAAQIGVVFQDFRLLPNKTVFENVAFALQVIGKPRHAIAHTVPEVLDLVGLARQGAAVPARAVRR